MEYHGILGIPEGLIPTLPMTYIVCELYKYILNPILEYNVIELHSRVDALGDNHSTANLLPILYRGQEHHIGSGWMLSVIIIRENTDKVHTC